jgi:hypothetical protein
MINSIDKFKKKIRTCLRIYSYSKFKGGAHVAASGPTVTRANLPVARGGTGAIVLNFFYMSTGRCLICKNSLFVCRPS